MDYSFQASDREPSMRAVGVKISMRDVPILLSLRGGSSDVSQDDQPQSVLKWGR